MSQYNSMPPPGAYVPPSQAQSTPPYGAQQQQQGYQQPQATSSYQSSLQGYGQSSQSQKGSGGTFGQMMNQAVTTSKPMLNKLSKTISSKLGSKPSTTGTPQHLQSYTNYQQHYGQQAQTSTPPQSQTYNPHAQPTQQQPQPPNAYPPQQSPHQQSHYGQGQNNYLTQQIPQAPQTPYTHATPPPQSQQTSHNTTPFNQGGDAVGQPATQAQHGQFTYGQTGHAQGMDQAQYQHQPLQAQYSGQQMGVVGGTQHFQQPNPQSPHIPAASPHSPSPQQTQWQNAHTGSEQSASPSQQQQQPVITADASSYFSSPNPQTQSHNNYQPWTPLSPAGSESAQNQAVHPSSSPPPPPNSSKPPVTASVSPPQSQTSTPAPQPPATLNDPPTAFIAELPADMGNLSFADAKPVDTPSAATSGQASPYQAYQTPNAHAPSSPGFTIARRAVSISNAPFADPWRFADPLTELPTREFYVLADLLFDTLDRKFEPQNTGVLEASKILRSWIDLTEDAIQLFSYNSFSAFGKLWSLQSVPHIMVPCQPSLMPIWNFNQHSHAHELKLAPKPAADRATYIPALNRAGWYKFFFLEMMHGPDNINKLLPRLCNETYKPGVLHHPALSKRDRAEAPALQARAAEIQTMAINQVCSETKAAMLAEPNL